MSEKYQPCLSNFDHIWPKVRQYLKAEGESTWHYTRVKEKMEA
jgi:hypothetical protein